MEPHSIGCDDVDLIQQAQDRVQAWALADAKTTFYHQVLKKVVRDFFKILHALFNFPLLLAS